MNDQKYALDIIAGGYERTIRRLIAVIIALCVAIVLIVGGFLWYLNQYDFTGSSVEMSTDGGGDANYIGQDGDIYNGPNPSNYKIPDP